MDDKPAIAAGRLRKEFQTRRGTVVAVADIDLSVAPGETFGLIGPDGAGKTTTLRLLLGLLSPTAGTSSLLGYDSMRETYAIRQRVGYIAQQFALPPDLSVAENINFFARVNGVRGRQRRQRISELLDFAGLAPFTGRLAGRLSGGMRKKLALACSLVHEPQVMLLDEPTLGVDPLSRREFWNLLGDLRAERGLTIFVSTPYMDEAERCNRVALIYEGQIIACDTPRGLKRTVPGELLQFLPQDTAGARSLLPSMEGVLEVQSYGRMLHVFVDNAQRRQPQIAAALSQQQIAYSDLRQIEPRMEEAFISLVRHQRSALVREEEIHD